MHAERLDRAGILQRQRDFRALREAAIHAQHAVRRAGGEGALAGGQGGEQKGVRGHGRVEELDDADADLVAHVGQVRAAPAHGVVGTAREPGVFRVEVLGSEKEGRKDYGDFVHQGGDFVYYGGDFDDGRHYRGLGDNGDAEVRNFIEKLRESGNSEDLTW